MKDSNKRILKYISSILVMLFFIQCNSVTYADEVTDIGVTINESVDEVLESYGTPADVISNMSNGQKEFMISELKNSGAEPEYISFSVEDMEQKMLGTAARSMTATELSKKVRFTIVAYKCKKNGVDAISIFPSFIWLTNDRVRNDVFAYSLPEGWEILADTEQRLNLKVYNGCGTLVKSSTMEVASSLSETGVGFVITGGNFALPPCVCGNVAHANIIPHCEGYSVFYVRKKKDEASNTLYINYTHDTTSLASLSYGINIGYASVSVTPNKSGAVSFAVSKSFTYK